MLHHRVAARAGGANGTRVEIRWGDVVQWSVEWGGSDSPDTYEIETRSMGCISVDRRPLAGRETELLEFARTVGGIEVLLKSSVD